MANPFAPTIIPNPLQSYDDDDGGYDEPLSQISITIKAPVRVVGNNNTTSVDPGVTGSKVASAIITGLKQLSGIADGLPMIDEHGRPRPVVVDVDAPTIIEGSDNIVGERAVFASIHPYIAKVTEAARANPDVANLNVKKRERDDEDQVEDDDNAKRPKTE